MCKKRRQREKMYSLEWSSRSLQVREAMPDKVFIFLTPPRLHELKSRIVNRGIQTRVIKNRMSCKKELGLMKYYDYSVVNDKMRLTNRSNWSDGDIYIKETWKKYWRVRRWIRRNFRREKSRKRESIMIHITPIDKLLKKSIQRIFISYFIKQTCTWITPPWTTNVRVLRIT